MTAEILTIGDEILIGQITNTNSVWIAQQLNFIGVKVVHMASVSDEGEIIKKAFDDAMSRADFVFITGGLGPTKDDVTKKVFADYFGVPLVLDEKVFEQVDSFFTKRGRVLSELNRQQALVPEGCTVIPNRNGTAPGMWMQKNKTVFISMPGVPYEMKGMVTDTILPKIKLEYSLPFIYHKSVLTQGIGESVIAEMVEAWEDSLAAKNIKLAYLPQPGMVRLRLSGSGNNFAQLKQTIEDEIVTLQGLIGKFIYAYEAYGEEPPSLEKVVSDLLRERKQTLALAESCTGGYLSSLFTAIPGASEIFKGAIVPYTNLSKHTLLQVDDALFTTVGSVSKEVVEQLAPNVLRKFDSDYAIAISGIAGPGGGTAEKPVGTVWVAVADRQRVISQKFLFGDNRQRNIVVTAAAAINMLRKMMLEPAR